MKEFAPSRKLAPGGAEREYQRLIDQAQSGDAVVVYYSGHGGMARNPRYRPREGDEATLQPRDYQFIVPVDIAESTEDDFRGITSPELSHLLGNLTAKTRNVTVIADCCHSGGMFRGLDVRIRGLREEEAERWSRGLLPHLERLKDRGIRFGRPDFEGNPHAVRLVATQSHQLAGERDLGFLTAAFRDSLQGVEKDVRVTWRTLIDRIRQLVQAEVVWQRPEVEGPIRRYLFELEEETPRDVFYVAVRAGKIELAGGRIHGVEKGDLLEIVPMKKGKSDKSQPIRPTVTVSALRPRAAARGQHLHPPEELRGYGNLRVGPGRGRLRKGDALEPNCAFGDSHRAWARVPRGPSGG
ncbi:MAG: caspase family protein [Planctomycetota bacterium]